MWKHMMQAAEEFIAGSLFQHSFSPGGHNGFASRPGPGRDQSAPPRASDILVFNSAPIFQEMCRQGRLKVAFQNGLSQRCG